mgnify:CR=1 FL=1
MTDKKGYYTVLHLDETAGEQEIKAAFRREVKLYHPDRNDSPEARETYLKLNEAYRVLTDPDARKAYDGNMDGGFIPCCKCGKLCRQPRFILFEENGARRGGVFCRDCASREQFRAAVKIWKKLFTAPVKSWSLLKTTRDFGDMPADRNFAVLMQNAAAFAGEKRFDRARALAKQARLFASGTEQRGKIDAFLNALPSTETPLEHDTWTIRWTDTLRVYLPLFSGIIVVFVMFMTPFLRDVLTSSNRQPVFADYQSQNVVPVKFDPANENLIYHTVLPQTEAYQAPDSRSGVLAILPEQTPLRVTGYVPKSDWVQVMTAAGVVVFVDLRLLRKGAGSSPLRHSKAFRSES